MSVRASTTVSIRDVSQTVRDYLKVVEATYACCIPPPDNVHNPSALMFVPEMKEASSESKYPTKEATSSGCAGRPQSSCKAAPSAW